MSIENATEQIKVSRELLEQWTEWSEPVQIRALRFPDGEWTLLVKRVAYEVRDVLGAVPPVD